MTISLHEDSDGFFILNEDDGTLCRFTNEIAALCALDLLVRKVVQPTFYCWRYRDGKPKSENSVWRPSNAKEIRGV